MKKISIIIPCYNSEKYIRECFASIKKQTMGMEEIQVIFVNDASTDGTWEILQGIEQEYPDSVTLVNLKENHKQGGARNQGLVYAVGEYVAFVDSDDWLDVTMCEKVYQKAKEFDVDILQFPFIHVYGENHKVKDTSSRYGFLDGTELEIKRGMLLGILFTFGSQNKIYRRSLLEQQQAAFVEGRVYEEPSFVYPLLFEAKRFYNMEEGLYYYRQTEVSVTGGYMGQKTKLYDHPEVQMELLKKLVKKRQILQDYYAEVEYHFLHSYYMETLYFAGKGNLYLGVEYFQKMQQNVLELFPEYEENPYLKILEFDKLRNVLKSLKRELSQEELNEYCMQVVEIMEK